MPSKLYSIELHGLEGKLVEIEVDVRGGIPAFHIVGLPDTAVQEARERVRGAIKNSDFYFPRPVVVVNLAPADLKKMGPRYDLPIALGVIALDEKLPEDAFSKTAIVGELALNGAVRPITGILATVEYARQQGFKSIILPKENADEAALISGIEIMPAGNLMEALSYLRGKLCPLKIKRKKLPKKPFAGVDMALIRGQWQAKRALEIAAAGGHNLLFCGPPGTGKTMMAQALAGILPAMSQKEMLELTKLYSIAGLLPKSEPLITERPFRAVHHTASAISIVGGGNTPMPGEISLAHHGVLFMDELAEFPKSVLEVLRQPLESQRITISRARGSFTYPARFILMAATNPCPCGYWNAEIQGKRCACAPGEIMKYQKRLSGPLLDRIDIHLNVRPVESEKLLQTGEETEKSPTIRQRLEKAVTIQQKRFRDMRFIQNADMDNEATNQFCKLNKEGRQLIEQAILQFALSARGYYRLLKLSRTIADLAASETIQKEHLGEALQYRNRIFQN